MTISRIVRTAAPLVAVALLLPSAAAAQPAKGAAMPAPVVFFDIAGPDQARQTAFYKTVFGWNVGADGRFEAPVAGPPLSATLRADPAEKVIYIGVPDVTAALAKVTANGGAVVAPRFEVKGVVVLGLFTDRAGNRMGLVEMAGNQPKVP